MSGNQNEKQVVVRGCLPDEICIFRYMSLGEFIGLISSKELFFRRILDQRDPEEMSIPAGNELQKLSDSESDEGDLQKYNQLKQKCAELRQNVFVNCWCEDKNESYAHWKVYAETGVAIRSTVGGLKKAIGFKKCDPSEIFIDRIKYVDQLDDEVQFSVHELVCSKRPAYGYEKEIRAYFDFDAERGGLGRVIPRLRSKGRGITVDLNVLIDGIYISPFHRWTQMPLVRLLVALGQEDLARKVRETSIQEGK